MLRKKYYSYQTYVKWTIYVASCVGYIRPYSWNITILQLWRKYISFKPLVFSFPRRLNIISYFSLLNRYRYHIIFPFRITTTVWLPVLSAGVTIHTQTESYLMYCDILITSQNEIHNYMRDKKIWKWYEWGAEHLLGQLNNIYCK